MELMGVLVLLLAVVLGLVLSNLRGKMLQIKTLRGIIHRYESFPLCFSLQEAVNKRLTEVGVSWYENSREFLDKGRMEAADQDQKNFNSLYALVEGTYGNHIKLRERDIRNYLPEELKKAS